MVASDYVKMAVDDFNQYGWCKWGCPGIEYYAGPNDFIQDFLDELQRRKDALYQTRKT